MRFFHIECGHEVETYSVDIECPIPDVGVVGAIPSPIERTSPKIFQRAFCPKCGREVFADELLILDNQ